MKIRPQRTFRYYHHKFVRMNGSPHFLASGFAIGVFVGITPTIPFHSLLAFVFAFILRGSTIAALLATLLVSNPLTFVLQYYLSWEIGAWITGTDLCWENIVPIIGNITTSAGFDNTLAALAGLGGEAIFVLMDGGILLALPLAVAGYFCSFFFFRKIRDKRWEKHRIQGSL